VAHERQLVYSDAGTVDVIERAEAVLVERPVLLGDFGLSVVVILSRPKQWGSEIGDRLV
jgi:hypothetical protein